MYLALKLCHRGGKNRGPTGTRNQGLSLTMRVLCQLSYRATWSSFDIFPLLNKIRPRICSEQRRNNETCTFDARCPSREPPHWPPNVTGEENIVARPGLEPRASRLPCEYSANWATEPHGRPLTVALMFVILTKSNVLPVMRTFEMTLIFLYGRWPLVLLYFIADYI